MNNHRSYVHSLSSSEEKVWKNIEPSKGFEPITKQQQQRALLYQLNYEQ